MCSLSMACRSPRPRSMRRVIVDRRRGRVVMKILTRMIIGEYDENYRAYGARKMWMHLRRRGVDVARCTVERIMKNLGLPGVRRGKKRTTVSDPGATRAADVVERDVNPLAPNRVWVADCTYVSTGRGWVYVAFVIDAYARRIVGWRVSTSMSTGLVVDAINQAISLRRREGITDFAGVRESRI